MANYYMQNCLQKQSTKAKKSWDKLFISLKGYRTNISIILIWCLLKSLYKVWFNVHCVQMIAILISWRAETVGWKGIGSDGPGHLPDPRKQISFQRRLWRESKLSSLPKHSHTSERWYGYCYSCPFFWYIFSVLFPCFIGHVPIKVFGSTLQFSASVYISTSYNCF